MPEKDKGVKIEVSARKDKKYVAVLPDGKRVHFGQKGMAQWKDQTPVKAYQHLDHGDPERRQNYYRRHGKEAVKHSAKWFSHRFLW